MSDPQRSSVPPAANGPRLPQKSAHSRRNAVLVVVVLALVGLAAWWFFGRNSGSAQGQGQQRSAGGRGGQRGAGASAAGGGSSSGRGRPSATVGTATAEKANVPLTITAIGTVQPTVTATVRSQVSGVLKAIYFKEGQLVSKGQALAQVDPGPATQSVAQAQGTIARDAAQLAVARQDLKRYQTLLAQDSIAKQQVDTQAALVKQLEGTVAADKAAAGSAQITLGYTTLRAPVSGRIGLRQADIGNYVSPGDANGVAIITTESPMDVEFALPQSQIAQVREASRSSTLPAVALDQTGKKTLAQGSFLTLNNVIDTATGTLKAKARFDNQDGVLFPSEFVNVQLQVGTADQAIVVPVSSVRYGPNGSFVFTLQADQTAKLVNVTTGATVGDKIVIAKGLNGGETVITEGADRIDDGSKVTLADTHANAQAGAATPGTHGSGQHRRGGGAQGTPQGQATPSP
ncbi:efflux RND transporter periplasmic adaptor subunit [Solilutibacter silvestris]|uniref:RND efflux transport protein n=1 Tax=Solilutibacter silvestris TaxID=1645665 RepID=A0A2K1Q290_9GAMM|nr:efflux RND transporter periplasmic adaptor subunit [Lysobacter silvestris]PNS09149.1 RND efflux transport protein [Lysobacter silvestris]